MFTYKYLCKHMLLWFLGMEWLAHMFNLKKPAKLFSKMVKSFPSAVYESYSFSISLSTLSMVVLLSFSHSSGCVMVPYCGLNLISLITNDVDHVFMCLLAIHIFSLVKYLFKFFAHFKSWVVYSNTMYKRIIL